MEPYSSGRAESGYAIRPPAHAALARARERKGLTQQQAADLCGINVRQYQKFESGERDVAGCAFSLGLALCRALDIDPFSLIP